MNPLFAPTRGVTSINSQKNRTWVFSNPDVLEKTDSLCIDLSAKKSSESREVSPGIVLDYDDENNLVGIDIDNASNKLDLKQLVLIKIPAEKQTIAT